MTQSMPRTSYDIAADDLVSVLYCDKSEYERIRFEYGLLPAFMPDGNHRKFTEAVYWLYENNKPIHDTTVIERAPQITPQWLAERITLYDDTRVGQVAYENTQIVKDEGLLRGTRRLLQIADTQLQQKGAIARQDIVSKLTNMLATIGVDKQVKHVKASEHGKLNRLSDAQTPDGVSVGLPFLDNIVPGGYEKGHIWWIGGAYKGRKTTLGLNMSLGAALSGQLSPAILSGEMQQGRVQRQLEAMLAVAWLAKKGYLDKTYTNHNGQVVGHDWVDANLIKIANRKYAHLADQERYDAYCRMLGNQRGTALFWAQQTYDNLPIRVYDSTPEHGGLATYGAVDMAINLDMVNYGGDWFVLDYLQLFEMNGGGHLFDEVRSMSRALQFKAKQKDITLIVLAQLNEATIQGAENYSAGVKGGGDPAQTADYFIRTQYNDGTHSSSENELALQMKLSRHGAGGNNVRQMVDIHPKSGLILGQKWIEDLTV